MKKYLIKIEIIPKNLKKRIIKSSNYIFYLAGYKKIFNKYKVPILELNDHTRIWMLKKEIKTKI
uniref:Cytochrome b6-f complex subunit PetP n=1 Tax=Sonderella linearis TaxID=110477 RepID=A0A1Z1MMI7_9FLOR|nr:cytochrome b6-f complex subunit PetP [Sonderella linearis]ARW67062.1 cytochrome b6-f complex subunit PetP [Sonderella linearis]